MKTLSLFFLSSIFLLISKTALTQERYLTIKLKDGEVNLPKDVAEISKTIKDFNQILDETTDKTLYFKPITEYTFKHMASLMKYVHAVKTKQRSIDGNSLVKQAALRELLFKEVRNVTSGLEKEEMFELLEAAERLNIPEIGDEIAHECATRKDIIDFISEGHELVNKEKSRLEIENEKELSIFKVLHKGDKWKEKVLDGLLKRSELIRENDAANWVFFKSHYSSMISKFYYIESKIRLIEIKKAYKQSRRPRRRNARNNLTTFSLVNRKRQEVKSSPSSRTKPSPTLEIPKDHKITFPNGINLPHFDLSIIDYYFIKPNLIKEKLKRSPYEKYKNSGGILYLDDLNLSTLTGLSTLLKQLNLGDFYSLSLTKNRISSIEGQEFSKMKFIRYLFLDKNKITKIRKGTFRNLKQLRVLRLRKNQISNIEEGGLSILENLIDLDLSDNKLFKINNHIFKGLENLSELNLAQNKISIIEDDSFADQKILYKLLLHKNELKTINEKTFAGLVNIYFIQLYKNPISIIHPLSFKQLPTMIEVVGNKLVESMAEQHKKERQKKKEERKKQE